MIKIKDHEMGDYPGLSRWTQPNHMKLSWLQKTRHSSGERFNAMFLALKMEEEAMSQGIWQPPEAGMAFSLSRHGNGNLGPIAARN